MTSAEASWRLTRVMASARGTHLSNAIAWTDLAASRKMGISAKSGVARPACFMPWRLSGGNRFRVPYEHFVSILAIAEYRETDRAIARYISNRRKVRPSPFIVGSALTGIGDPS
ncbi:hypothetical protein [Rhizobium leguminosarum]|uniref:hypothetical protein n=1 Tax=Rhizobium leguminosarum TaxID=384 RepID=UPI001C91A9F4|nr:hypothetical protein [Rhizobium leguminosarum]MBY2937189.1 hypothetical protein [Rhizobium leguminosarum]